VKAGTTLGILGYTGSGIDQRRAHVHVELNLFLSSRFEAWHAANFATPNHHGVFNGLNLIGLDLQALYLAQQKNPAITAAVEPCGRQKAATAWRFQAMRRWRS
jgi:hypothetical protein